MADIDKHRATLGEVSFPPEVTKALQDVTELPDDPEKQADFFDKVQDALTARLREES